MLVTKGSTVRPRPVRIQSPLSQAGNRLYVRWHAAIRRVSTRSALEAVFPVSALPVIRFNLPALGATLHRRAPLLHRSSRVTTPSGYDNNPGHPAPNRPRALSWVSARLGQVLRARLDGILLGGALRRRMTQWKLHWRQLRVEAGSSEPRKARIEKRLKTVKERN